MKPWRESHTRSVDEITAKPQSVTVFTIVDFKKGYWMVVLTRSKEDTGTEAHGVPTRQGNHEIFPRYDQLS